MSGLEVPAVIASNVDLMRFSAALAQAREALIPTDAAAGMRWYNGLTKSERLHWHRVAGSAVPADAWRAFQARATLPD